MQVEETEKLVEASPASPQTNTEDKEEDEGAEDEESLADRTEEEPQNEDGTGFTVLGDFSRKKVKEVMRPLL